MLFKQQVCGSWNPYFYATCLLLSFEFSSFLSFLGAESNSRGWNSNFNWIWLVVWKIFYLSISYYGMSSFPLANSYVSRWAHCTTRDCCGHGMGWLWKCRNQVAVVEAEKEWCGGCDLWDIPMPGCRHAELSRWCHGYGLEWMFMGINLSEWELIWVWINTYENTIFRGLFTSILTQLFWCELQGYNWFWDTVIWLYGSWFEWQVSGNFDGDFDGELPEGQRD